jgi:hypothetical protein
MLKRGERGRRRTRVPLEQPCVCHQRLPPLVQSILDPLDLPQMLEHAPVRFQAQRIEHSRQGRIDLVFEQEDVPADLTLFEIEHAGVEATEDGVKGVGGRSGATNGGFEGRGEVVAVEGVGGF